MKHITAFINENTEDMCYRMILTYDFSDDATRSSFEELVEGLGFVDAEDQSTYVLPYVIQKQSKDVVEPIKKWSTAKDIEITEEDFVQLFYLIKDNDEKRKIASKYLKYNPKTEGLI